MELYRLHFWAVTLVHLWQSRQRTMPGLASVIVMGGWVQCWAPVSYTHLDVYKRQVLLVLVYTQLPFAILPLYAAAEKFDFGLLDAARDLGAGPLSAFSKVFVPGVRRGILSAAVMVFVCCLGQYVIPQMVGGTGDEMLGSKIAQRVFSDRNLPHASALAGGLMLAVLLPMLVVVLWQQFGRKEAE